MTKHKEIPTHQFPEQKMFLFTEPVHKPNAYDARKPHKHMYYEVFLFKKGRGIHVVNGREFQIKDCSVHFITPYTTHILNQGDLTEGKVIGFKDYAQHLEVDFPYLSPLSDESVIELEASVFQEIWLVSAQLDKELEAQSNVVNRLAKSYLTIILTKILGVFEGQTCKVDDQMRLLYNTIEHFYKKEHKLSFYVQKTGLSLNEIKKIAQVSFQLTPKQLITKRLSKEAQSLLMHTALSVKEIAYELGFFDESHFIKFFENQIGLSPKKFRIHLDEV